MFNIKNIKKLFLNGVIRTDVNQNEIPIKYIDYSTDEKELLKTSDKFNEILFLTDTEESKNKLVDCIMNTDFKQLKSCSIYHMNELKNINTNKVG